MATRYEVEQIISIPHPFLVARLTYPILIISADGAYSPGIVIL